MSAALLVACMALVTFAMRYLPLVLAGRVSLPAPLVRAMRYVPPAVLTAIVVPAVLMPSGSRVMLSLPHLAAAAAAGIVAWRSRSLMLTILVGMVVFFAMRAAPGLVQ